MVSVDAVLDDLQRNDVVARIWRRDHTVWKPDPTEVTNRLAWLAAPDEMRAELPDLRRFADEVRSDGIKHVVLLGMGGSSLSPEVLRRTFGSSGNFPELVVLDSTVPSRVRAVTDTIAPEQTLFLVSSKSGGTVEPNVLYKHFRSLVEKATGRDIAGRHFVAVTDPGTVLEELAQRDGYRRVFSNTPDVGGRYSVLTFFGLVPAALVGLNLDTLLDSAAGMRDVCGPEVSASQNPGAVLGATIGSHALAGRDKLTLVASPSVASFGVWVEQLIAESTGKEGRGVVPIAEELVLEPDAYGADRFFVYLRVDGDDNDDVDAKLAALESAGHPIDRIDLSDPYDIGGEFFRWEMATAIAGSILQINPFDQPGVQRAKEETELALREYLSTSQLGSVEAPDSIETLLSTAGPGNYMAVNAFVEATPAVDAALAKLRAVVMQRHRIATTLGYGPRFLHSTGQLHKGGANNGLFLQLTADQPDDVPIPGEAYTFATLAAAQALGDLRVLKERGRRVARVHLGTDPAAEIGALAARIS